MSKFATILMTIILTATLASATIEPRYIQEQIVAAQDAVTMGIYEAHAMRMFVHHIFHLRSIQLMLPNTELVQCLLDLDVNLRSIKLTLHTLKDRRQLLNFDATNSLREMMENFNARNCNSSLSHVDVIVPSMLTRKANALSAVIYDLVHHASEIEKSD